MLSRTAIDKLMEVKDCPLAIGDTVLCRHGQGTLIDYTPECKRGAGSWLASSNLAQ